MSINRAMIDALIGERVMLMHRISKKISHYFEGELEKDDKADDGYIVQDDENKGQMLTVWFCMDAVIGISSLPDEYPVIMLTLEKE